jgi:murein biosynthesis integral membrane protein MurJ
MSKQGGAVKTVSIMIVVTLLGKVLGLVRDSLVGSYFGTASVEGAAFNYASVLPRQFMDVMFASAISASFIPVFNGVLEKRGREDAFKLGHNFISIILTASALITAVCILLAHPIVALYDGGKSPEAVELATKLIRLMFLIIIISCLAFSLTGILQSLNEFTIPAAMGLVSNGVILLYFIFFMRQFGVFGLSAAYVAGWAAQFLIQLPFLWKNKFRYRFRINLRDPDIKRIGVLMLPVMVSTWVTPVNILVNGKAALLDPSGIAAYNAITYANTLYTVVSGVFVLSVSNVIFPRLSVLAAHENHEEFGVTLRKILHVLCFFLIPMTLGLMALSQPIVRIVYERGQFTAQSTALTSKALIYFSIGICGFGLQTILTRAFYAFQEGKTPMITAFAAIAANLVLSFVLVKPLGVGGPALASSISITLAAVLMLAVLRKRMKSIIDRALVIDIFKMLVIGFIMYGCAMLIRGVIAGFGDSTWNRILEIALPAAAGLIIYAVLALALRLPEAKTAVGFAAKFVRNKLKK